MTEFPNQSDFVDYESYNEAVQEYKKNNSYEVPFTVSGSEEDLSNLSTILKVAIELAERAGTPAIKASAERMKEVVDQALKDSKFERDALPFD